MGQWGMGKEGREYGRDMYEWGGVGISTRDGEWRGDRSTYE